MLLRAHASAQLSSAPSATAAAQLLVLKLTLATRRGELPGPTETS